jgi:uncharacterized protein
VAPGHVVIEEDRMTPEERRLIEDLFERMVNYGAPDKDREAEALIRERVRAMPDAVYMLTQSVLVQEQALEAANERVAELEDRLRALEESQGGPPRRSGGFLSGGFAGRRGDPDPRPSSVPQVGARATPSPYDRPSAWGPPPPPPGQAPPPAGGGGGFMRSAMATAAGVAGGVLAAESIRNLLGGSHARAGESGSREASADQDRRQDLEQDRELDQADQDRKQDLEQDRELEQAGDQGDYDNAEDDGFDSDGDFGDDSLDV